MLPHLTFVSTALIMAVMGRLTEHKAHEPPH